MRDEHAGGFGRRDFLKGAVSAAIAAGFVGLHETDAHAVTPANRLNNGLPDTLQPLPSITAAPGTEKFWKQVKRAFTLPDDFIHMNTGTTGSQLLFSQINLAVYNNYKSADPRDWQKNLNADFPDLFAVQNSILGLSAIGPRQAAVAAAYGANPDEIVLSYNTTDACNLIFAGTPWQPGDRIITTSMEHNAIIGPIAWARDYHGVEVVVIDIPSNFVSSISVPEVVSWFETELARPLPSGAKQYVVFSEIFYKNGVRMPVKEICSAARSRGGYSIVDSAHAWGMLPVDCHDYGADFIAGAGHKWLCGPKGAAFLWVRADRREAIRPTVISHGANDPRTDRPRFRLEFDWTGTADPSAALALPAAIDWMAGQDPGGWPAIMAWTRPLRTSCTAAGSSSKSRSVALGKRAFAARAAVEPRRAAKVISGLLKSSMLNPSVNLRLASSPWPV